MRHLEGNNEIEEDDQVRDIPNQYEQPVFFKINKQRTEMIHQEEEHKQANHVHALLNRGEKSPEVAPSEIELKELSGKKEL